MADLASSITFTQYFTVVCIEYTRVHDGILSLITSVTVLNAIRLHYVWYDEYFRITSAKTAGVSTNYEGGTEC